MSANLQERLSSAEVVDIWPDPRSLPSGLLPVAPFDNALLPRPLAPWVRDIAERMQAPVEYVAVAAMVAAGSVLGRKVGVRPQENTDWYEVPNFWGCIVGRPGVMKSPALQQALKPLNRLQASARTDHEQRCSEWDTQEIERELRADARKKALRKRLEGNANADTSDLSCVPEIAPELRRYIVNDTSYQSLGELLRQNNNGLLVHRDELLSLLRSLDRDENVEAKGFYLTGWNGTEGYTFDRIGRGFDLHIPSVTISMIGSTQPGKLRDYISGAIRGGVGDDGMIQRFSMLVWPDVSGEWIEHDREPDAGARAAAFAAFDRLDRLSAESAGATVDPFDTDRPYLRFDEDGRARFQDWRAKLEARLRAGELHPAMESHLSKYRKLIPTLALVHHLTSGMAGPIGDLSVLAGLAWGEFLETHAQRAYSSAIDSCTDAAREVLRHARRGDLTTGFTLRDVTRPCWSGLTDRQRVLEALDLLEDHGCIRSAEVPAGPAGGRPTVTYAINPKVLPR